MTTQTQTGAPATPNAQALPGAADPTVKKPGLDEFLKEFDTPPVVPAPKAPVAAAAPATTPAGDDETRRRLETLEADRTARLARDTQTEIEGIVDTVKNSSDFLKGVDSDVVYGFLQGLGAKDPRFRTAFMQRYQKPDAWAKVLEAIPGTLEEKLRPIGSSLTAESRSSVMAAARTSSTAPRTSKEKSPAEIRAMSPRQFEAYKRERRAG